LENPVFFARARGVANATAGSAGKRDNSHIGKLKMILSRRCEEDNPMTHSTDNQDRSFPYVLVCSMFGTIVSLASVWLATAISYAPMISA